jgi:predicted DNA binding CopG/RHH family protein
MNKIEFAEKDVIPGALSARQARFRVTMFLDLEVLEKVRKAAALRGLPYQTYINQFLREAHLGNDEDRIRRIVRDELKRKRSA